MLAILNRWTVVDSHMETRLIYEIIDELRDLRNRDEVRCDPSYGRQGMIMALSERLPAPSNAARMIMNMKAGWDWSDWVAERFVPDSLNNTHDRILDAAQSLHDVIKAGDRGRVAMPFKLRDEFCAIGTILLEAEAICRCHVRRHIPHQGTAWIAALMCCVPWCALCGTSVPAERALRSYYCENHDPLLAPAGYKQAVRAADRVCRKLLPNNEFALASADRQDLLRRMWRAISERTGSKDWDIMQAEFEHLARPKNGRNGANNSARERIVALRAQGLEKVQIVQELKLEMSRQYVYKILRDLDKT